MIYYRVGLSFGQSASSRDLSNNARNFWVHQFNTGPKNFYWCPRSSTQKAACDVTGGFFCAPILLLSNDLRRSVISSSTVAQFRCRIVSDFGSLIAPSRDGASRCQRHTEVAWLRAPGIRTIAPPPQILLRRRVLSLAFALPRAVRVSRQLSSDLILHANRVQRTAACRWTSQSVGDEPMLDHSVLLFGLHPTPSTCPAIIH